MVEFIKELLGGNQQRDEGKKINEIKKVESIDTKDKEFMASVNRAKINKFNPMEKSVVINNQQNRLSIKNPNRAKFS
jgi:hypothetical protein